LETSLAKIRVLCVDDSVHLTSAWERLIKAQPDMELAGTLTCADELIETAKRLQPSLVMMDLTMAGRDPLDVLVELKAALPDVQTVIYSGRNDDDLIERAMQAGAAAFLDKGKPPTHILQAIRRVARGEQNVA
jgi:two-component system response regulator DesR